MNLGNLIANGKVKEAIEFLKNKGENSAILLMSRYNQNEREKMMGMVSFSDYSTESNRINNAILSFSDIESVLVVNQNVSVNIWLIGGANCEDPETFKNFVSKTRHGVPTEYKEGIEFGKAVLSFMREKFDSRNFEKHFTDLRYAVEDLESVKNLPNLNTVIENVRKHKELVLRFLKSEAKESLLETMYNRAKVNEGRTFCDDYDTFLKKYLEINNTVDSKTYEKWLYDRNEFFAEAGADEKDLFFIGQLASLRSKWLRKFTNF